MKEGLGYLSKIEAETFSREPWIKEKLDEIKGHNLETYEHSFRVAHIASAVAFHEHVPSYQKSVLIKAALLHDIGKIEVPNELLGAEVLNEEEKKQIDKNVRESFEIVRSYDPMVAKVVIGHHEFQRRRYPRQSTRISEEMLVKQLQFILALCDSTDALLSKRSYKEAWSKEKVEEELIKTFQEPSLVKFAVETRMGFKEKQ